MYIEAFERVGGRPVRLKVSQVVIYRDDGTPVSLAMLYGADDAIFTEHVGNEAGFNRALQSLGIDKVVIVETVDLPDRS